MLKKIRVSAKVILQKVLSKVINLLQKMTTKIKNVLHIISPKIKCFAQKIKIKSQEVTIKLLKKVIKYERQVKAAMVCLPVILVLTVIIVLLLSINKIVIYDGTITTTVHTFNSSVDAVLESAGIVIDGDDVAEYNEDGNIVVIRKFPVTLIKGEEKLTLYTGGGTVAELFSENKIEYSDEDKLNFELTDTVKEDMVINFTNIEIVYEDKSVSIPFESKTIYSVYLKKGQTKVVEGVAGEMTITYRKKYVNGVLSEVVKEKETITKNPTAKITYIGTLTTTTTTPSTSRPNNWISELTPDKPIKLDANGNPVNYTKVITGIASAYSPADGTGSATGVTLKPGYVAVDPKKIPYGTKLYIKTVDGRVIYGYAVAADTGGFVTMYPDRVIDLFFPTNDAAWDFGLKQVNIYILE